MRVNIIFETSSGSLYGFVHMNKSLSWFSIDLTIAETSLTTNGCWYKVLITPNYIEDLQIQKQGDVSGRVRYRLKFGFKDLSVLPSTYFSLIGYSIVIKACDLVES